MAYRITLDESWTEIFHRISGEQITTAEMALTDGTDLHRGIHEARKSFKRIRALLILARPSLPASIFKREYSAFGNIARRLSTMRDRQAILDTLAKLEKSGALARDMDFAARLKRELTKARDEAACRVSDRLVEKSLAALEKRRKVLEHVRLAKNGFGAVARGASQIYAEGRKLMQRAYRQSADDLFHDWRKRVQQHWRHTQLLTPVWPDLMALRNSNLKALAELLGDDHDLSVLRWHLDDYAASTGKKLGKKRERRSFVAACRHHQWQLRDAAHPLGVRLYAQSPRDYRACLRAYWQTARELAPGPSQTARLAGRNVIALPASPQSPPPKAGETAN